MNIAREFDLWLRYVFIYMYNVRKYKMMGMGDGAGRMGWMVRRKFLKWELIIRSSRWRSRSFFEQHETHSFPNLEWMIPLLYKCIKSYKNYSLYFSVYIPFPPQVSGNRFVPRAWNIDKRIKSPLWRKKWQKKMWTRRRKSFIWKKKSRIWKS